MAELYQQTVLSPFSLFADQSSRQKSGPRHFLLKGIERLSGLSACQSLYSQVDIPSSAKDFPARALNLLGVNYKCSASAIDRIPASGPCILIANHPFGGIEGLVLMDLISKVRPDFKLMGNFLLGRIPQLRERLICVDPFSTEDSARANLAPLRASLNWLAAGGLLVIFPAGEVSSWQSRETGVTDPEWSTTLARLVRKSKATVVPAYFPGRNNVLFQLAGRIDPRLRTLLLPRMLKNKRGETLKIQIGNPITQRKLVEYSDNRSLTNYLRLRTYALGLNARAPQPAETAPLSFQAPLLGETAKTVLRQEIAQLGKKKCLLRSGEFDVYLSEGYEAPYLLREIGRLRELTFRQAGEGTGKGFDLDQYDKAYEHLFIWNHVKEEVVGAYRIGRVDQLLAGESPVGLYASTLFDFRPELLEQLRNGLELGRSFVRPEYQKSYAPLLLLWKGIGHYLVRNRQYRYLFGPVSISSDYQEDSRRLITSTLARHYQIDALAKLVKPRLPVALTPVKISGVADSETEKLLRDMEEVSTLIADLEADSKGIPVLLRHYLGLGGQLLAFNLDPEFSNVIDGLLLVDLYQTETRQLRRYMGHEGLEHYLAEHKSSTKCA